MVGLARILIRKNVFFCDVLEYPVYFATCDCEI